MTFGGPIIVVLTSSIAQAHGGLHQSRNLWFVENEPVIETTYGVIHRDSDGQWAWLCEEISGIFGDGWTFSTDNTARMWFTGLEGARVSDDACSWRQTTGAIEDRYVTAVVGDPVRSDTVWAITGSADQTNPILVSRDGGVSFTEGSTIDAQARFRSIKVSASGRIWTQGLVDREVWVWTSTDGEVWSGFPVQTVDRTARIQAIGPDESVWLVTETSERETLWRVAPDGETAEVFTSSSAIAGVAVGPDDEDVWLGGPDLGLLVSDDGGLSWQTIDDAPRVRCLTFHADARWACTDNWEDGAAVMRNPIDAPASTWQPVLWFGDVRQLQPCDTQSRTYTECAPLWEDLDPASGMNLDPLPGEADDTGTSGRSDRRGCCQPNETRSMGTISAGLGLLWGLTRLRRRPTSSNQ